MNRKENISEDGNITSGKNISNWTDSVSPIVFKPLTEDLETDIVIVGGGLAGISIAYCLSQEGRKVILVEDGYIGSGETGRTTAHIVTALDNRYYTLENIFGEEDTQLIAESHIAAIDFIENTVKKEKINCEFERLNGYLFLHPSDEKRSLDKELEAASRAGIKVIDTDNVPGLVTDEGRCICFPEQAQFHPLKYLKGLCAIIEQKGGKIFTETHAAKIDHKGLTTKTGYTIKANHIVVATNSPVNDKYAVHLKQTAFRTYVIGALIKKDSLPKALWWDTGDQKQNPTFPPYHYVRVETYNDQYDLLISGGEDHQTGDEKETSHAADKIYASLEKWTREHFPIEEIKYRWSGQVMEPMDSIAYIGRNPLDRDNVYIVTGDSGNGMTHCTIAGMLITDLITGKENKWKQIYAPSRFTLKTSSHFFKEAMYTLKDFLKTSPDHKDAAELSSVKTGEGKIVNLQQKKYGVFRDKENLLHIVSAKCAHLGCTVAWNKDEQTWDCPCHGSRYTYKGKVINGPANNDLAAYSEMYALETK